MKKYKLLITDLDGTLIEFVGFGRQNSTTILHGILINAYICIHS